MHVEAVRMAFTRQHDRAVEFAAGAGNEIVPSGEDLIPGRIAMRTTDADVPEANFFRHTHGGVAPLVPLGIVTSARQVRQTHLHPFGFAQANHGFAFTSFSTSAYCDSRMAPTVETLKADFNRDCTWSMVQPAPMAML